MTEIFHQPIMWSSLDSISLNNWRAFFFHHLLYGICQTCSHNGDQTHAKANTGLRWWLEPKLTKGEGRGRKNSQENPVSIELIFGVLVWKLNQREQVLFHDVCSDPSNVTLKSSQQTLSYPYTCTSSKTPVALNQPKDFFNSYFLYLWAQAALKKRYT